MTNAKVVNEMNESDSWRAFGIGLAVGSVLGAILGLLYAPHSGRETRGIIRDKLEHAKHQAEEIISDARKKSEEIISVARSKTKEGKSKIENPT